MIAPQVLEWLVSTGATAVAIGAAAWFGREWIGAWLSRSVQHAYDTKLETLRAELRSKEHEFAATLRAREADIGALREGALSGVNARNALLIQKRVEATEQIWSAVVELNKFSVALKWLGTLSFEEASASVGSHPAIKDLFASLQRATDPTSFEAEQYCERVRPYVSESIWSLYSTYSTVMMLAHLKIKLLSEGHDGRRYFNFKYADEALKLAMPEHTNLIDEQGDRAHHLIIGELRDKILASLRDALAGHKDDHDTIKKSTLIIEATTEAQARIRERASPPA